jgi:hypothetical protein
MADIVADHIAYDLLPVLLAHQVLSERGGRDFRDVLCSAMASTSSSLNPHIAMQSAIEIMGRLRMFAIG